MGQPNLSSPSNLLFPRGVRRLKTEAKCHVSATTTPPSTTQRFVPRAQSSAASSDQQFAARTPPIYSLRTLPSGMRKLDALLILVSMLPSLTFGAMFWLGVIRVPWSTAVEGPMRAIQSAPTAARLATENPQPQRAGEIPPVLTAPAILEAKAGQDVAFAIALDGTDGVPARSIIAISGMPHGTTFSSGFPYGEAEWNLKPDEIGDLHLVLPNTASGESKLRIQLLAPDGDFITDTETVLKVAADSDAGLRLRGTYDTKLVSLGPPGVKPEATEAPEPVQELETMGAEVKIADPDPARATLGDVVQLPPPSSKPAANDDGRAWIVLLSFVNLREGPSSSARVIGEMPKGARLRAFGRTHGWVHVVNPATSATGWIYAENVGATSNLHHGSMRGVRSKVGSGSDDSAWPSLSRWLASP